MLLVTNEKTRAVHVACVLLLFFLYSFIKILICSLYLLLTLLCSLFAFTSAFLFSFSWSYIRLVTSKFVVFVLA